MKAAPAGSTCPTLVCSFPKGPSPLTVLRLSTGPLALLQKLGKLCGFRLVFFPHLC